MVTFEQVAKELFGAPWINKLLLHLLKKQTNKQTLFNEGDT